MPYILIRGNLASYGHKHPFRVLVSGLKAADIEQLNRFPCGGYSDESTVVYLQHPCVILTALEVLGYRVVASSSTAVKQDYNEYMWTMRKEFSDPEPYLGDTSSVSLIERDNLANSGREEMVHGVAGGDGAGCHGHQHHQCSANGGGSAVQSLDELDFDRGIWSAAMNNECDRLRTLVARGHLHDRDSYGYTALHYAARHGHLEACRLLLTAGLGVDEVTNGGVTALQRAAMMGRDASVELLLANGANEAHRDADGRTALHRAAEGGHLRCCQLLVAHRADLRQIEDERHQKPFHLVRDNATDRDQLRCLLRVPDDDVGTASTTSS